MTLLLALLLGRADGAEAEALPSGEGRNAVAEAAAEKSAGLRFFDWLQSSDDGYAELREGAQLSGASHWLVPRLRQGLPLPQASARELALQLGDDPRVPAELKARLKRALPSEPSGFDDRRPQNQAELQRLAPQIESMEERLDVITETMFKNVYNRNTNPQTSVNLGVRYQESTSYGLPGSGHQAGHSMNFGVNLQGQFAQGSYGVSLGGGTNDNGSYYGILGASGGMVTFGDWQLAIGEVKNLGYSMLVYGGINVPASSQFFNANSELRSFGLSPTGVGPVSGLFHLRRASAPTWYWPFTESQAVFSPRNQFYENWNTNKLYDAAYRLDLAPYSFWVFTGIKPYLAAVNTYNDEAQLRAAGISTAQTQNNRAYAAGLDISLENGTTILAEAAMSDWLRSDVGEAFVDSAYYAIGTLPVGPLTLALEGWQVGPRFITGGNDSRRSGNGQTGAYIDTMMEDTERGRPRTYAYQTIMREPLAMTNNSRHGAVKTELKLAWMTLASTLGYSEQIVPSGPWVQSHFVLNGLGYNGAGWFWRFGQAYAQLPQGLTAPPGGALNNQYAFASATQAPAYYNGAPMGSTYWQEVGQVLYQETQTHVLMSQTGVGDANILADSIKYTTSLRSSVAFDLKAVFDRDLPFDLSVSNDLRDTNDQANFPRLTDEHLLTQMVTESALRYGWSDTVELLAAAGYETWLTRHSRFPLFYISRFYGAGFDLKLDGILTGMSLQARTQRFEFEDMHFMQRNHHEWSWSIGTSIYY